MIVLLLSVVLSSTLYTQKFPQHMTTIVPVADLRTAPCKAEKSIQLPTNSQDNPYQGSQILLGESVIARKSQKDTHGNLWLKLQAIEQPKYTPEIGWHGFVGWTLASNLSPQSKQNYNVVIKNKLAMLYNNNLKPFTTLSMGSKLCAQPTDSQYWKVLLPHQKTGYIDAQDVYLFHRDLPNASTLRSNLVNAAQQFIGDFYSWGGRSGQRNDITVSSVDCSSFMTLVYAAQGLQIPRNAHDQYLIAQKVHRGSQLQPGDLVFFSPTRSKEHRVTHVLMYIGNDMLIEACLSGDRTIRVIPFQERIGKKLRSMKSGDTSHNITSRGKHGYKFHIYFGSLCNSPQLLQKLRNNFISPIVPDYLQ